MKMRTQWGATRKEHLELQQSFAQQREALHGATAEVQALRERSEGLEAELQRRQEAEAQARWGKEARNGQHLGQDQSSGHLKGRVCLETAAVAAQAC